MKTWADVRHFIVKNELPYTLIRFNMSLQGRLIETATGEIVAATVKEAAEHLKGVNRETIETNLALVLVGSHKA
jgi:hypothetical protein